MGLFLLSAPFLLGILSVVQSGLNRRLAPVHGLTGAVIISGLGLVAIAVGTAIATVRAPQLFPEFVRFKGWPTRFPIWYALPGMMGFCLVAGMPWITARVGAARLYVGLVSAQLVASLIWDMRVEGIPFKLTRAAGAGLALLGAWLASC